MNYIKNGLEYRYINDANEIEIVSVTNHDLKEIIIPKEIDGTPVTGIHHYAFRNCKKLKSINLPNTITSIGIEAFSSCEKLKEILLPESVEFIHPYAFNSCKNLETVFLPSNLTSVENGVFANCEKLKEICFPKHLESISYRAFSNSGLIKVNFPKSVKYVGTDAFAECQNLIFVKSCASNIDIESYAFERCPNLQKIKILGYRTQIKEETFPKKNSKLVIECPMNSMVWDQLRSMGFTIKPSSSKLEYFFKDMEQEKR